MDAWFQPAYFHTQSLREDFVIFQHTLTHDCQRQAVRVQTCKVHGDNGAVAFLTYLHGNTFLFRAATGKLEPFYCNLDDTVDANLTTQSAVETRDGLWYLIEDSDRYERAFLLYGISADSGIYTPDYQEVLLGDADGFSILYYQDVDSLVYWANEAAYRWKPRGMCMWSLGQEDLRLWEWLPKQV